MSSAATLASTANGDWTVWSFPIEGMTNASYVFDEHWALNDLSWAFSYSVVAIPLAAQALLNQSSPARPWHSASAWSPTP